MNRHHHKKTKKRPSGKRLRTGRHDFSKYNKLNFWQRLKKILSLWTNKILKWKPLSAPTFLIN